MTMIRVPRGAPAPTEMELRAAIEDDRTRLGLPRASTPFDVAVAGPYHVVVDGQELDEYSVWER